MRLERTVIQDELYLQRYIAENPDALPLDQLRQNIRLLVLVREFPTSSGPIDALATDDEAALYLIETKLYKNPDKRLVLAQVLDYGAALWKAYSDPDAFITRLDALMEERMGRGLVPRLKEHYGLESEAAADFVEGLKRAVASGEFRFVVLMDTVDDRLKDLIAYVNANSSFDLLGVGLDFYRQDDLDILIPTLHGAETKKQTTSSASGRRTWDEQSFFADASSRLSREHVQALKELHEWSQANADDVAYGTGAKNGSFSPKFAIISRKSVFSAWSNGGLDVNFRWLADTEFSKQWRHRFGQALISEGFPLPSDYLDHFVSLSAGEWVPRLRAFLQILSRELATSGGAA